MSLAQNKHFDVSWVPVNDVFHLISLVEYANLERLLFAVLILKDFEISFCGNPPRLGGFSPVREIDGKFLIEIKKI